MIIKNPNLLLTTKLTIKSFLQLISLRKLFSSSAKKRHLISIEKINSIRNIYTFERKKKNKIQLKNDNDNDNDNNNINNKNNHY